MVRVRVRVRIRVRVRHIAARLGLGLGLGVSQPRADDVQRLADGHRGVVVVDYAVRREEPWLG